MKVRITLTVTVNPDEWATEYGVPREDVRADVKDYIGHAVADSYPAAEKIITDVGWQ
ncbi:hypothetical protein SMD44_02998 [Streptomyces alboflavus]|uniref:Uncharacterized protein n=1 Tax=Streptomyces alboflavus TaxID=67267 RepID=A0A1Z1WAV1_9ACTN|nr:hypothetical protein [Streptomyces alboflavus]ARX83576.1 hypothetical protein SMD44_02998 [Streptomyces alboflavus]